MAQRNHGEPLVSVLIYIHNDEQYLSQCLSSIINQSLQEIEIICIDDGSEDQSVDIVERCMVDDERIVLLNKKNSGYGDSLNIGLKKAKGKYTNIIKSNSWMVSQTLETLYDIAENYEADIARSNYYEFINNQNIKNSEIPMRYTDRALEPKYNHWIYLLNTTPGTALYKTTFLKKNCIDFLPLPGNRCQNISFIFKAWVTARKICFTTDAFLHYRMDENIMSLDDAAVDGLFAQYHEVERFLKDINQYDDLITTMWIAKTNLFFQEASHINPASIREFLKKTSKEMIEATNQGVPFAEYFSIGEKKKFVQSLLNQKFDSANRIIRRNRKNEQRHLQYTSSKFHPYRTKAYQLNNMVQELRSQHEYLEQRIRNATLLLEQSNGKK